MKIRDAYMRAKERGDWCAPRAVRLGISAGEHEAARLGISAGERGAARLGMRVDQRGAGKIKAIIVTAILAFAVYAAVKIVPPYAAEYQLADKIQEQARFAVVNRYTDEQIRDNVFKVVRDLEIPVKREDIKVEASQQVVKIAMDYTVPIDLLSYHMDLHFTPSSENKSLY